MDCRRRFGRTILVGMGCLISTMALVAQEATQRPGQSPPGSAKLDESSCQKDGTSLPCQIMSKVTGADFAFVTSSGLAGMSKLTADMQAQTNPNYAPTKERGRTEQSVKQRLSETLPELDGAIAHSPTPDVTQQLQLYRGKFVECMGAVMWLPHESDGDYKSRQSSCELQLNGVRDQVAMALGFHVAEIAPDFRYFHWGDSIATVIAKEGKPVTQGNDRLIYQLTLGGRKVGAVYDFVGGHFGRAVYVFDVEHTDFNLYIDDFKSVNTILITKYGASTKGGNVWKNPVFQNTPANWGVAIATGQMSTGSIWETGRTTISHVLSGDNFKFTHVLAYQSTEYAPQLKKAEQDRNASGL